MIAPFFLSRVALSRPSSSSAVSLKAVFSFVSWVVSILFANSVTMSVASFTLRGAVILCSS